MHPDKEVPHRLAACTFCSVPIIVQLTSSVK
jgi:hypothetical protein